MTPQAANVYVLDMFGTNERGVEMVGKRRESKEKEEGERGLLEPKFLFLSSSPVPHRYASPGIQ